MRNASGSWPRLEESVTAPSVWELGIFYLTARAGSLGGYERSWSPPLPDICALIRITPTSGKQQN